MLSAVFSVMLALVFSLQGVLNQSAVTSAASGNVSGKLVASANVSGFESVAKGVQGVLTGSIIMFVDDGSGGETQVVIPPGERRTIKGTIRRVQMPDGSVINYETDASPVLNAVKVRSDIQESYNVMLRQVNKTVAKEVLGVKPDAVFTVPIADTGNGGKNVPILHEFFVRDYRLVDYPAGERRVNFNVGADTLDAPCGGKGQICCEGACFADAITYGAVKDENTRCYGLTDTSAGVCMCGEYGQLACITGRDPQQSYECRTAGMVKNPATDKCDICGIPGKPPCDASRNNGVDCFIGAASGGNCALQGSTDTGAGDSDVCSPESAYYCTSRCLLEDKSVRIGCDPTLLSQQLKDTANTVISIALLAPTSTTPLTYDQLKALAESDGTITFPFTGEQIPASDFYSGITLGIQPDAELVCKSGVYMDGICKQKIGDTNTGPAGWCVSSQKKGDYCCQITGESWSDSNECCSNNGFKGSCDGTGDACYTSNTNCPSHPDCSGAKISGTENRRCTCVLSNDCA